MSNQNQVGKPVNRPLPSHAREARPKPYLRPHNLQAGGHNVKIKAVKWVQNYNVKTHQWGEILGLYFHTQQNDQRYLGLNSDTLVDQVIEATGETAPKEWPGCIICIYPTQVQAGGENYDVIRVKSVDGRLSPAYDPDDPGPSQVNIQTGVGQ